MKELFILPVFMIVTGLTCYYGYKYGSEINFYFGIKDKVEMKIIEMVKEECLR